MTIQKSKWVKVADEVPTPETGGPAFPLVLCWDSSTRWRDEPFEATFLYDGTFYVEERGPAAVTHWRPLPLPPPENEW